MRIRCLETSVHIFQQILPGPQAQRKQAMASETINIALDGDVILVIGGVQDGEEEPYVISISRREVLNVHSCYRLQIC